MRRGSVLFRSYWQLMGVLDRMIEDPDARPAISIRKRPSGVQRQLRTVLQGGWLGDIITADPGLGRSAPRRNGRAVSRRDRRGR